MKHIRLFTSAMTVVFMLSGLAAAQHDHDAAKQAESQTTMAIPMQQRMMGDSDQAQSGMTMKQGEMMGKGMHQGGMMKDMQSGMMSMMHDPVFKTLHGAGCPGFLLKSSDKLALSEEQISELKKLKNDFHKQAIKNKADVDVAAVELQELLNAQNPDFSKVKAKILGIDALQQELRLKFLDVVIQARKVLTIEQIKTLQTLSDAGCKGMMKHGMMK